MYAFPVLNRFTNFEPLKYYIILTKKTEVIIIKNLFIGK